MPEIMVNSGVNLKNHRTMMPVNPACGSLLSSEIVPVSSWHHIDADLVFICAQFLKKKVGTKEYDK